MTNQVNLDRQLSIAPNWIDGQRTSAKTEEYQDVYSPYSGKVIGQVPLSTSTDVEQAVNSANKAFAGWKDTHIKERVQVMFRLKQLLEQKADDLAELVALESGKTVGEAKAGILKGIEIIEFACAIPNKIQGALLEVSNGVECRATKAPLGVVASITPFNFPVMVPLWTVPIALTTGNTMVLKPSEQVPFSVLQLAELLKEAGLPDGVFNVVNGGAAVVEAICAHPIIQAISFVGSTKVAKIVYQKGSQNYKRVLALGGAKNHLVLMPDADVGYSPSQIVDSAIGCAGQRCMAAANLVVVGKCDHLIQKMVEYARGIQLGHQMGAIINQTAMQRIVGYIDQAEKSGASILVDGRHAKPQNYLAGEAQTGYWVAPTLIDQVTPDMPCFTEEIFGPVLSILRVDTLEDALRVENNNPYGNAASIFTTSGVAAQYFTNHASAGMLGVNIGVPVPREPFAFGGWNDSKFGVGDITGDSGISFWTKDQKITTKWVDPQGFARKASDWMS